MDLAIKQIRRPSKSYPSHKALSKSSVVINQIKTMHVMENLPAEYKY